MALGLVDAGYRVLIIDQDPRLLVDALALAREKGAGERVFGVCVDLLSKDAAATIMQHMDECMGGIDVLINNAGVGPGLIHEDFLRNPPSFENLTDEMVRLFFEINAIAPFLLSTRAAKRMRAQKWGRIVNVTTSLDSMMREGFAPYGGTKASLEFHTATMARDLEETGVTANVLVPGGPADTNMIPKEAGFDRSQLINPDAMVPPLLWLVSDGEHPPNGKRVIASTWRPGPHEADDDAVSGIGWPPGSSKAIFPDVQR